MDPRRFDELSKGLASRSSRRSVVKGLGAGVLGGALALVGRGRADAKPPVRVGVCHLTGNVNKPVAYIEVSPSMATTLVSRGDSLLGSDTDCAFCGDVCESQDECYTSFCAGDSCEYAPVEPVDCMVSEWSDWSACSAECGGGTQTRSRTILTDAWCGGEACPELSESQACNTQACSVTCASGACTSEGACLDGECFTQYPNCSGQFGVVANGGGVNACMCGPGTGQPCETTGDCNSGEVCIIVGTGRCYPGCPAYANT